MDTGMKMNAFKIRHVEAEIRDEVHVRREVADNPRNSRKELVFNEFFRAGSLIGHCVHNEISHGFHRGRRQVGNIDPEIARDLRRKVAVAAATGAEVTTGAILLTTLSPSTCAYPIIGMRGHTLETQRI